MHANTSRAALDAAHLSPATPRPIVNMYDLDTSAYDIDPDGRTVRIYGAAFFRTAPQDGVRFTLVLSRADLRDDEAPAWIDFDSDDLEAAGLALAEETAEAALLDALRTPVSTLPERRPYSRLRSSISICLPSVTAPAALSTSAPRPDGAFSPIRLRRIPNLLTYTPIDATATTIRAAKPMARPIGPMRAISLRAVCPKKR